MLKVKEKVISFWQIHDLEKIAPYMSKIKIKLQNE